MSQKIVRWVPESSINYEFNTSVEADICDYLEDLDCDGLLSETDIIYLTEKIALNSDKLIQILKKNK